MKKTYDKAKITIDLEEYQDLIKIRDGNYDPDEIATIAANIAHQLHKGQYESKYLTDEFCHNKDYLVNVYVKGGAEYGSVRLEANVIKKPVKR